MRDNTKTLLAPWKANFRESNISPDVQRLINLCIFDLYFGPIGEVDDDGIEWPGFQASCPIIADALVDVPSNLWIEDGCPENWTDSEPRFETCEACKGAGLDSEHTTCTECNGTGGYEPHDQWYCFTRIELITALVGRELSEYVR